MFIKVKAEQCGLNEDYFGCRDDTWICTNDISSMRMENFSLHIYVESNEYRIVEEEKDNVLELLKDALEGREIPKI